MRVQGEPFGNYGIDFMFWELRRLDLYEITFSSLFNLNKTTRISGQSPVCSDCPLINIE